MPQLFAGFEVAHNDLAVAVLRHKRIGDELSIARKLLPLNRAPAIIISVCNRPLLSCLLRCHGC
jgi:hypothetical protein